MRDLQVFLWSSPIIRLFAAVILCRSLPASTRVEALPGEGLWLDGPAGSKLSVFLLYRAAFTRASNISLRKRKGDVPE